MSVPNSFEELIQLIRKSGMVDESRLTAYIARRQKGRGLSADPRQATDDMISDGILTNFQAEQFLLGKWRGFSIGKYKLLERIGVGGMGQVFLCEHMFMKRRVAIKVLPPAKAEQPAALGRFYREARAAGSLEHPNIVRTHDIDQDGNLHFIVMEYVDGSNLLEIVKKFGPMDCGRAAHYTKQVAIGLDFAFKSGVIHRDVKPGNILIDRKGLARVLDLGLARFFNDQSDMLTVKYDDKIVLGTADYVAPEQVANSHAVDVRADVYALGATLYFLLAGHPPFPTGTVSQKLLWHRTKEPTPIRQLRPEVPEGLAAILAKMMAKDPAVRYQSPAEIVNAITPWITSDKLVPSVSEMPVLCPAVLEGMEMAPMVELSATHSPIPEPATVGMGSVTRSKLISQLAADMRSQPAQKPFGNPAAANPFSAPTRKSFEPQAVGAASAPLKYPQMAAVAPAPTPSKPFAAKPRPEPSPFGSQLHKPIEPTPLPYSPQPTPHQNPALPMAPQSRPQRSNVVYNLALVSILLASIILGAGLVYAKFWKLPANNVPKVAVESQLP